MEGKANIPIWLVQDRKPINRSMLYDFWNITEMALQSSGKMLEVSINGAGTKHTKINSGRIKGLAVKGKSVKLLKLIETDIFIISG